LCRGRTGIRPSRLSPRTVLSYPAHAGYPVRRGFSVQSRRLWNTGSPAYAGDDTVDGLEFDKTHLRIPAARFARALQIVSPIKKRAQGTPGACCTRGLVCKIVRRNAHEHTGTVGASRHSLRNGFTAYAALSPATNSSCHRRRRIGGFAKTRLGLQNLRRLDTSNGCQDHTVLPYAAARLRQEARRALAPFVWCAPDRSRETRPAIPGAPDAAASTASHPNVRDDGQRPLVRDETAELWI
jgi:hypothetical protein